MDNTMNQAAALASMCQNQSMFLAECAANPVSAPRVLSEKKLNSMSIFENMVLAVNKRS